ncbi:hypothetical protein [Pelagibius sp. Alg239-R121]|uniref:hypothetical protein n=1 Tax=Pelagibius sp. Alg239-R121 TaxID=2993448 RepID=UPI0024A69DBE|nr:hypothetical protein [Pelagibius sp. Alg239-R121]
MVDLNDDVLIAYSDGQLDEKTAAEVESALEKDPAAREIIEQFRTAAQLASEAFAAPFEQDVPERLLKVFEEPAAETPGSEARITGDSNVADLSQQRTARQAKKPGFPTASNGSSVFRRHALPLAASVALIVGIGGGLGLSNFTSPSAPSVVAAGTIPEQSLLHAALERTPSLEALEEVSEDGLTSNRIEPQQTFIDTNQRYCREYRIIGKTTFGVQDLMGVACRTDSGSWTQQIAVSQQVSTSTNYQPAGEDHDVLGLFVNRIMKDAPLDGAAESRLLQSDWQ